MNINSTTDSTQPHIIQPQPMPPSIKPTAPNKYKLRDVFTDQFQPEQFKTLAKASQENPDVRPDVIAAAKQFVTDSNYPTPAQLSQLAKMIVDGRDSALPARTKSSTTQPPMTEPPMTYPPMTEPPTIAPMTVSAASQTQPPITYPPMTEPPMTEPPTIAPMTVSAASQQKE